jgi:hypothetical protein
MTASQRRGDAPTTSQAASNTPLNAGVSPASSRPLPGRRAGDDEIHVGRIVEQLELGARRGPRRELHDAAVEALRDQLAPEHVMAVRSEGMAVGKSVAGDPLAGDDAG